MTWWVYVIRCGDGSFYTGISTDIARRLAQHRRGQGARYTRGRGPLGLWWCSGPYNHGTALREERRVKRLTHEDKLALGGELLHDEG
ncbi:GIY-YIG nuclease family protein [Sulfobacillus harzensis]|uniref:GIY-YIG nuclease family protein n=1 Tax=Sulfobacillus harzensis TaxID=2729629 RepID=UPI0030844C3E